MAQRGTIGVLGAGGTMGFAMARNLAHAGYGIRAWNRSAEKAQPLREDGVEVAGTPAAAAQGADVVLTMLADAPAVLEVMTGKDGALANPAHGLVWLQMSTIGEEGTERCLEEARERAVTFVDAPVLGTKEPAEQGKLVVLAAGSEDVRPRVAPIFDAVGQRTVWVGEPGTATRLKLALNTWILAIVEGAAETLALAEGLGLNPRLVLDAVAGGSLDLPYLQMKGSSMIERRFDPSFRLTLATKDATLAAQAADRHGLDLPLIRTIRDRLAEAVAEHGEKDMSATFLTSAPARRGP